MFRPPAQQGEAPGKPLRAPKEQESRHPRCKPTRAAAAVPSTGGRRLAHGAPPPSQEDAVSSIFYIIGVVVVVLAIINWIA